VEFRIADTFTDSLARLTGEEQKIVKTTCFDLQLNPAHPSIKFHKVERSKDKDFWSVRAGDDIRLIVHKRDGNFLLCYVDHHEDAYAWASRRKIEVHPATRAAQIVEIRERVEEIVAPQYVASPRKGRGAPSFPFSGFSDEELMRYGVPSEWIPDVKAATEDTLLSLADHLPYEAAEALLELATGGKPAAVRTAGERENPFDHPDARRRFRTMRDVDELERALAFPWEKWTIFLHPEQRELVEKHFSGPARVSGSAGTGKTIVALHRAVFLAKSRPGARVLLATFSETLAGALRTKLRRLIGNEPKLFEQIEVYSLDAVALRLYKSLSGKAAIGEEAEIRGLLREAAKSVEGHSFPERFLLAEWKHVVDAWQLTTWEEYRGFVRMGRKTRLSEPQRRVLWTVFEQLRSALKKRGLVTQAEAFTRLGDAVSGMKKTPYDFIVVDEAQDIDIPQLRFLAAFGSDVPNGLFFAGDLGQRIFQQPFSWKAVGVDVRGRSKTLRVNYRTSHQIRSRADLLLDPEVSDVDGNTEKRDDTVSLFNGPLPSVIVAKSEEDECERVVEWLAERLGEGVLPHETGVFVRSPGQLERAKSAVEEGGLKGNILDERVDVVSGCVSIGTMHLAKGLEFRAVVVMACDDEVVPLQERIEEVSEEADLRDVYDTERYLLYVACTRARDWLLVTGVEPASEFLDDLRR